MSDLHAAWASYDDLIGHPDPALRAAIPDALVIAPARTGSSWLYALLREHPDVFTPAEKELRYFCTLWRDHDVNWYLHQFASAAGRCKVDVSPTYAQLPERAIRAVHRLNDRTKLILLVRDPIRRAWSHVKHMWRNGEGRFLGDGLVWPPAPDDLRFGVVDDWPVLNSTYADILQRWTSVFSREQILVGVIEAIERDPLPWLTQLLEFLGLPPRAVWSRDALRARVNVGIPGQPSEDILELLRVVCCERSREAVSLLASQFNVTVGHDWDNSLVSSAASEIRVGSYRGHEVYASSDGFWANPSEVGSGEPMPKVRYLGELTRLIDGVVSGVVTSGALVEQVLTDIVLPAVRRSLSEQTSDSEPAPPPEHREPPTLIVEGFRGYNLIGYQGSVYALAQEAGPIDLQSADLDALMNEGLCVVRPSVAEAQMMVELLSQIKTLGAALNQERNQTEVLRRAQLEMHAANLSVVDNLQRELCESKEREQAARAQGQRLAALERSRAAVLEQAIENLGARIREKEAALSSLSAEVEEMRTWIRELQQRLVRISSRARVL